MNKLVFPHSLLSTLLQETPFQPATNFWRALELQTVIDRVAPLLRATPKLLDLGCGDGSVMHSLKPYFQPQHLIGLDADGFETDLATQRGIYQEILTAGAQNIPLPDGAVTAVFSNSVLEHIADLSGALQECGRVTAPGGIFVATVPGSNFFDCLGGSLLPWVNRQTYNAHVGQRIAIVHSWTAARWQYELAAAGFQDIQIIDYLNRSAVRRWENIARITSGLLYQLGGAKAQPIDIQRRLKLRQKHTIPRLVAEILARLLAIGVKDETLGPWSGYLLIARKA